MDFGKYLGFALFSTIKFLFAPFGGPAAQLNFIETYLSCVIGASLSATVFYFLAEFFLERAHKKRVEQLKKDKLTGKAPKKKFTRTNRKLIKMKQSMGILGVTLFAPLLLSIPVGTIIVAKFFGNLKLTYPLLIITILVNGLITTGLAYSIDWIF
jgi:CBS domain containing-hemolysin-like protein